MRRLDLSIHNQLADIPVVQESFRAFVEECHLGIEHQRQWAILIDELLTNIISYAYKDTETHIIQITFEHQTNQLVLIFQDDGETFNPLDYKDVVPFESIATPSAGGLGIRLIRHFAEHLYYERLNDFNILKISKGLS